MEYIKPSLNIINQNNYSEAACLDGNKASEQLACRQGPHADSGCGAGAAATGKCKNGSAAGDVCSNGAAE